MQNSIQNLGGTYGTKAGHGRDMSRGQSGTPKRDKKSSPPLGGAFCPDCLDAGTPAKHLTHSLKSKFGHLMAINVEV